MTAKYYDQPGDSMDLIPTLSYGLGVPCTVMATVIVERRGLRVGLLIGGFLTGVGKKILVNYRESYYDWPNGCISDCYGERPIIIRRSVFLCKIWPGRWV